jgi:hypothetical protein
VAEGLTHQAPVAGGVEPELTEAVIFAVGPVTLKVAVALGLHWLLTPE